MLPCPRLTVWRISGAVTWSEIWMFQISLSPCAVKSANSFGMQCGAKNLAIPLRGAGGSPQG